MIQGDYDLMPTVALPYGGKELYVNIPDRNFMGFFTPEANKVSELEEEFIITRAINNPIGTPKLSQMVRPGMKVIIIADDKTRPTPVKKILPILLNEINSGGVSDKNISVIFALGTHSPMNEDEMVERSGVVANRIKLFNSKFRESGGFADCGRAPDGMHVFIDKRVAEADFKIGIGSIIPHPECGWGGGAKIICPGVASEETVTNFHLSFAYVDWNTYGSDKAPVRLNMEKWINTIGLDFIINAVITPDNRVYQVVAGDYIKAHRRGIRYGCEVYLVRVPEKADIVLITSFRADDDFWLASKAVFAGELIIKEGGTLILVTPCPNGIGPHPEYADFIGCDDWDSLLKKAFAGKIRNPIALSSGVAIAKMRKRFDIAIVSEGLNPDEIKTMKCQYFVSVEDAVYSAIRKNKRDLKIAVLPYGISTLPIINNKINSKLL